MNILVIFLGGLVVLIPIIITIISFVVYSNNNKSAKLLLFTLPNFIFSIILPIMISIFMYYDANYIFTDGFSTFINDFANNNIYVWILLVLTVIQISITCINGVHVTQEEIKFGENNKKNRGLTLKLSKLEKIILIYIIAIFISFLITDVCMLENEQKPIFSRYMGGYLDGGTTVYLGFGYKIIDYNKLDGYDGYKIGTWFMSYDNSL